MQPQRLLPLCAALVTLPAAADDLFFAELPVVASVSRLPQRVADAPASVTVIDREMIRASGIRSLNDIFRLVPGFQTFAHSDTSARVNYHGITDDNDFSPRVQVLVDGRSLHSPLFRNGVNWSLIPVALEDIERIEVVRGTNAVSYGTNAFLGVINIITVDPSLVQGASVSVSRGTQGVADHGLRVGGKFGESGNFRLTYQEVKDDGLEDNYDWSDKHRNQRLDFRLDQQLTANDLLELNLGQVKGQFVRGSYACDRTKDPRPCGPQFGSDLSDPIRNLEQSSLWMQLRWTRTLAQGQDLSLRYAFLEDKGDDAFVDTARPVGYRKVNQAGDRGRRHELEAMHYFALTGATKMVWGASWRLDQMKSATLLRDKGEIDREVGRLFANLEWRPKHWLTANFGGANEWDSLAGSSFSPRASLAFHLTPENTVRLGYAQAWRSSSITAYRSNYRQTSLPAKGDRAGNPDLPLERLDAWELAFLGDWRRIGMSLDVRHFREKVTDRSLQLRPGPDRVADGGPVPISEQSIQDLQIRGYEMQWRWQPLDGTRLLANHASIRIDQSLSGQGRRIQQVKDSNLWFPADVEKYEALAENGAPRRSSSILIAQTLPGGFDISLARYWVDAIKWTRNTNADKYQRTDARIGYRFNWGGQKGELAYVQQSVDGAHVEQRVAGSKPNPRVVDRRHWVSLRLDF